MEKATIISIDWKFNIFSWLIKSDSKRQREVHIFNMIKVVETCMTKFNSLIYKVFFIKQQEKDTPYRKITVGGK